MKIENKCSRTRFSREKRNQLATSASPANKWPSAWSPTRLAPLLRFWHPSSQKHRRTVKDFERCRLRLSGWPNAIWPSEATLARGLHFLWFASRTGLGISMARSSGAKRFRYGPWHGKTEQCKTSTFE